MEINGNNKWSFDLGKMSDLTFFSSFYFLFFDYVQNGMSGM